MAKPIDNLTIDGEKLDANLLSNLTPASELLLSMDGASTLTLAVDDPNRELLESGVLARVRRGRIPKGLELSPWQRLGKVQLGLEGTFWRLAGVTLSGPITTLTFEQEIVARLRTHTRFHRFTRRYIANGTPRGVSDRWQVVGFAVKQVKNPPIPARIWQGDRRVQDDEPTKAKNVASKGIPADANIKIKGVKADSSQIGEINTALGVAEGLHVTSKKVLLALCVAGIGESGFRPVPNAAGSPYGGVFQGKVKSDSSGPAQFRLEETDRQAHYFLTGGKGFQAGGAIVLAKQQPSLSPGAIATRVEASGELPAFYDKYREEAEAILLAYGAGSPDAPQQVRGQYSFTIGTPKNAEEGEREDYFESCLRLAREVDTYFFATTQAGDVQFRGQQVGTPAGDMFIYGTGAQLLKSQPSYTLAERWEKGDPLGTFQVGMFDSGDWHYNRPAGNLTFSAPPPDRWFAAPGLVAEVLRMGPFTGRWLTFEVRQPLDATIADFTLTRPSPPKPEPAGTKTQVEVVGDNRDGGGQPIAAHYPLSKRGDLIGKPHQGTHTLGNWQSDNAIDIGVPQGTPVFAVDDGTISPNGLGFGQSSSDPGSRFAGYRLHLKTSKNTFFYTHLKSLASGIQPGKVVKSGDRLGTSGVANGVAHLHISCERGDPIAIIWDAGQ